MDGNTVVIQERQAHGLVFKKPNSMIGFVCESGDIAIRERKIFYALSHYYQKCKGVSPLPVDLNEDPGSAAARIVGSHFWVPLHVLKAAIGLSRSNNNDRIKESLSRLLDVPVRASCFTPSSSFISGLSGETRLLASYLYAQAADGMITVSEVKNAKEEGRCTFSGSYSEDSDLFGEGDEEAPDLAGRNRFMPVYVGVEFSSLIRESVLSAISGDFTRLDLKVVSQMGSLTELNLYAIAQRYATWHKPTRHVTYRDLYDALMRYPGRTLPNFSTWKAKYLTPGCASVAEMMTLNDPAFSYQIVIIEGRRRRECHDGKTFLVPEYIALQVLRKEKFLLESSSINDGLQVDLNFGDTMPSSPVKPRVQNVAEALSTKDPIFSHMSKAYSALNKKRSIMASITEISSFIETYGYAAVYGAGLKALARDASSKPVVHPGAWIKKLLLDSFEECSSLYNEQADSASRIESLVAANSEKDSKLKDEISAYTELASLLKEMRLSSPKFAECFDKMEADFLNHSSNTIRRMIKGSPLNDKRWYADFGKFFCENHERFGIPFPANTPDFLR